jgi:hypothetical protein
VFTVQRKWRRWAGQRNELLDAVELAADVLSTWSGYESQFSVSIELDTGLTQRSDDLAAVQDLHRDDLRRLETITITVEPSRAAWMADLRERRQASPPNVEIEEPELVDADVELRVWRSSGVRLAIRGPDRTSVEGLAGRLAVILSRSAAALSRNELWPLLFLLPIVGFLFGALVPRWLGFHVTPGFTTAETVGVCIATLVGIALGFGLYRAFPPIEVLDEGQAPATRRLRRAVVGIVLALIVGIASSAIYDALR